MNIVIPVPHIAATTAVVDAQQLLAEIPTNLIGPVDKKKAQFLMREVGIFRWVSDDVITSSPSGVDLMCNLIRDTITYEFSPKMLRRITKLVVHDHGVASFMVEIWRDVTGSRDFRNITIPVDLDSQHWKTDLLTRLGIWLNA